MAARADGGSSNGPTRRWRGCRSARPRPGATKSRIRIRPRHRQLAGEVRDRDGGPVVLGSPGRGQVDRHRLGVAVALGVDASGRDALADQVRLDCVRPRLGALLGVAWTICQLKVSSVSRR